MSELQNRINAAYTLKENLLMGKQWNGWKYVPLTKQKQAIRDAIEKVVNSNFFDDDNLTLKSAVDYLIFNKCIMLKDSTIRALDKIYFSMSCKQQDDTNTLFRYLVGSL